MEETIIAAIKAGNLPALKRLLNWENKDIDLRGATPLELCSAYGHILCVRWLVEEIGAPLRSAFNFACTGDNLECVKYLVQCGADINGVGDRGQYNSPLECAVNNLAIFRYLLSLRPKISHETRTRTLTKLLNEVRAPGNGTCNEAIYIMLQCGTRIPIGLFYSAAYTIFTFKLLEYETALDKKYVRCIQAMVTLMFVLKEKGVPKALSKHLCNTAVLPTWIDDVWLPTENIVLNNMSFSV